MKLLITVRLKGEPLDEPDIAAAEVLERLAARLREEAPHDFITSGADTLDAAAQSRWERD